MPGRDEDKQDVELASELLTWKILPLQILWLTEESRKKEALSMPW